MGILARILGVVVLAVTLGSGRSAALADDAAPRPNIIFVMLDDLDVPVTQPYYGEILPETMKLANTGVDFANAFATTPVCCPSRAAFLSGKHGHNTNVLTNGGPRGGRWQFIDDEPESLPALMYFHGYRTAIFGKYMNGFHKHGRRVPDLPYGWTDGSLFANANLKPYKGYNYHLARWRGGRPVDATTWQADDVRLVRYGDKDQDYSTDVVFDQVFEFIEQAVRDTPGQPFFTMIQPTCPHFPLPPAPRHRAIATEKWGFDTFPKDRPNYFRSDEGDGAPDDKPLHLQHTWKKRMRMKDRGGKFLKWTGAELPLDVKKAKVGWNELDWYNRMGSMYACDEGIAEMVRRLQALGVWENTFVIVTSDNGYNFGAHALGLKMAPYDEAARIPFWVFGGEQLGLSGGIIEEAPILNIDLAPTVLEAAGAEVPQDMDGRSLMPFLRGANETPVPWREAVYFEYYGPGVAEGHFAKF
jgi:N-acetylglucosamine-6-sulfatase